VSGVQLPRRFARYAVAALGAAAVTVVMSGCATSPPASATPSTLQVVAAENFWGSLAGQLGGSHAHVTSIINKPGADPHDYEPTAADAIRLARAQLAIVNGIGYDGWASKLIAANPVPHRDVISVGDVVGARPGDNPHRWYSPGDVQTVISAITSAYKQLDPADATYFDQQKQTVLTQNLKSYFDTIATIKSRYAGTPVGASESVFTPLAQALGLRLLTPRSFLDATSEGSDPTAADKTLVDQQIQQRQIKVYVYNSQNATPDVQAQVSAARRAGIAITTISETLTPAGASFQDWQVRELTGLQQALAQATGA